MDPAIDPRQAHSFKQYDANPTILRGTQQVLAAIPEIDELRRWAGRQNDLSTDLFLILSRHNARHRRPVVVLLRADGVLRAAVIFAERCVLGFGIGLLRAGDQAGDGAVIAPEKERKAALVSGIDALLRQRWRCHTVAATLSGVTLRSGEILEEKGMLTEFAGRAIRRALPLSPTMQETLNARFRLKKRKNLLYYRRRLSKTHEVEFVPQMQMAEAEQAMLQLSHYSWPYRTAQEVAWHCEFLRRYPECFCMGLRLKTGVWLSLITGWRVDGVTHMPWQLNHDAYKDESLMQVMRTYLVEHECAAGQAALSWVGGTVAFQTACEPEACVDVLKSRRGVRSSLLRHVVAPLLAKRDPGAFTGGSLMLLLDARSRGALSARLDPDS
jgi:hypothetical protein